MNNQIRVDRYCDALDGESVLPRRANECERPETRVHLESHEIAKDGEVVGRSISIGFADRFLDLCAQACLSRLEVRSSSIDPGQIADDFAFGILIACDDKALVELRIVHDPFEPIDSESQQFRQCVSGNAGMNVFPDLGMKEICHG